MIRSEETRAKARAYYHANKATKAHINRANVKRNSLKMQRENPAKFRAKKFFDTKKKRNTIADDVTKEWLTRLFATVRHCECCGAELALAYDGRRGGPDRFRNVRSPSVDRVDNREGYSRTNIAITCWTCNLRKTDLTADDLRMFLAYVERCSNVLR